MSADRFKRSSKLNSSGSWNKYSYAMNDPVNFRDPKGREAACPDGTPPDTSTSVTTCDDDPGDELTPGGGGGEGENYCDSNPGDPSCAPGEDEGGDSSQFSATLKKALQDAVSDLSQKDCFSLFGNASTRANGYNPATLIQQIFGNGDGTTKVGNTTISTTFASIGIQGLTVLTPLGNIKVLINTSTLDSGSVWDSTITLLHELGHIYNDLSGSGGSTITKWGDVTDSNDDKITANCLQNKAGHD